MATVAPPRAAAQMVAVGAQFVLLAVLTAGTGLGTAGWVVGVAYAAVLYALLAAAARRAMVSRLGPANLVTLTRAALVGGVTALVAGGLWNGHTAVVPLVAITSLALALDAVDGQVARRTGTVSALGARFDMEVDAFLLLVLSIHVATFLGPWVLAIGALRYAFVAASRLAPWMRSALPTRFSGKAVAALQGIVLTVATGDVLPHRIMVVLVSAALALLVLSFGRDVVWLWHRRVRKPSTANEVSSPGHPVAARLTTVLAGLLVFLVLLGPNETSRLTPGAFLRIPVEGLVGVALLVLLPARARTVVAALSGAVLGLLGVLTILDIGFGAVLSRPFDPLIDWSLLGSGVEFLTASIGRVGAIGAVAVAVLLTVGIPLLMSLAVLRLTGLVVRREAAASRVVAALGVVWCTCAVLGVQLVPGVPVAAAHAATSLYDEALQVRAGVKDRETFAAQLAVDPFHDTPGGNLLAALRGKDVVLAVVESYGRTAVEKPEFATRVGAVLDDGTRRLGAVGFAARSAYLTSSTSGGASWLAHATLLSGLWVDNQQRYRDLEASDRMTLTSAFARAGWRTVGVMPGVTSAWPEAAFYGYDHIYDAGHLGYRGPSFSWATMPDQYTLAAFERLERGPRHTPVMAEIPLVSSHAPWSPIPRLVSWHDVGDGSVFTSMAGPNDIPQAILNRDPARVRADYLHAIEYSLESLISYVETYGDDRLVVVVLGDHQPSPIVTGDGAGRDVPITIITRDRALLDRVSGWDWQDGLRPGPMAPVWRMDTFRDRFLTAFGQ